MQCNTQGGPKKPPLNSFSPPKKYTFIQIEVSFKNYIVISWY